MVRITHVAHHGIPAGKAIGADATIFVVIIVRRASMSHGGVALVNGGGMIEPAMGQPIDHGGGYADHQVRRERPGSNGTP